MRDAISLTVAMPIHIPNFGGVCRGGKSIIRRIENGEIWMAIVISA